MSHEEPVVYMNDPCSFHPEQYLALKLAEIKTIKKNTRDVHVAADDALVAELRELGYGEAMDVYESIDKWYS